MNTRIRHNLRTHEVGSRISGHSYEIVFRELPCDCGASQGRMYTVHEGNPTGHSVGCPVFLRWHAADAATAFAEALQAIQWHAETVGVVQDEHSTRPTADELLEQSKQCAERVLREYSAWLSSDSPT